MLLTGSRGHHRHAFMTAAADNDYCSMFPPNNNKAQVLFSLMFRRAVGLENYCRLPGHKQGVACVLGRDLIAFVTSK